MKRKAIIAIGSLIFFAIIIFGSRLQKSDQSNVVSEISEKNVSQQEERKTTPTTQVQQETASSPKIKLAPPRVVGLECTFPSYQFPAEECELLKKTLITNGVSLSTLTYANYTSLRSGGETMNLVMQKMVGNIMYYREHILNRKEDVYRSDAQGYYSFDRDGRLVSRIDPIFDSKRVPVLLTPSIPFEALEGIISKETNHFKPAFSAELQLRLLKEKDPFYTLVWYVSKKGPFEESFLIDAQKGNILDHYTNTWEM